MYSISGTSITLTRGDSFNATIEVMQKSGSTYVPYEFQPNDKLMFYLKHKAMNAAKTNYIDRQPLITKNINTDSKLLSLLPEDTKGLAFGDYVYDIELTFEDGSVDTFINNASLVLVPEVG